MPRRWWCGWVTVRSAPRAGIEILLLNRHEAAVSYSRNTYAGPRYRRISVSAQYNLWQNLLAQSVSYNEQNGVTTYRPVNINGNWGVNSQFSWYSTLDKKKRDAAARRYHQLQLPSQ